MYHYRIVLLTYTVGRSCEHVREVPIRFGGVPAPGFVDGVGSLDEPSRPWMSRGSGYGESAVGFVTGSTRFVFASYSTTPASSSRGR